MLVQVLLLIAAIGIAAWFYGPGLMAVVQKVRPKKWIVVGLLTLASLRVPTSLMVETNQLALPDSLQAIAGVVLFWLPLFAIGIAALLFFVGLNGVRSKKRVREPGGEASPPAEQQRYAVASLVLSALVLGETLYNFYWLIVWDNTSDPLDFLLLIPPVLAGIFAGVMVIIGLKKRAKIVGFGYALVLIALLVGTYWWAEQVDYRQLTVQRAERISQALETYHVRLGHYPNELRQLSPGYLLVIPKPVVINAQDWCYQGGKDSYQLGVVDREHWSSPILFGWLIASNRDAQDSPPICSAEIVKMQSRNPRYYGLSSQ